MSTTRQRLAVLGTGVIAVVVIGAAIAFILTVPPTPATLASPRPSPSGTVAVGPVGADPSSNGVWLAVEAPDTSRTFVGYRIQEKLGADFITWPNEAVGRTGGVTGRLEIRDGILQVAEIEADLRSLQSDHSDRDNAVAESALQTAQFSTATFRLTEPVSVVGVGLGVATDVEAHGELTIKGVTKPVVWPLRARWDGDTIEIAGQVQIDRLDYGVDMGRFFALRVADEMTVEAQLRFGRECVGPCSSPGPSAPGPVAQSSPSPSPSQHDSPVPVVRTMAGGGQIAVVGAAGDRSHVRIVDLDKGRLSVVSEEAIDQFFPFWTAGGDRLGYAQVRFDSDPPPINLVLAKPDGSGPRLIANPDSLPPLHPSMSSDGQHIAFHVPDDQTGGDIWVTNQAGKSTQITHEPGTEDDPSWSPDGRLIAYTRFGPGSNLEDIWVMNSDGTNGRAIATTDGYEDDPAWAPDGRRIAFVRDGHIAVMNADGSNVIALTDSTKDSSPTWSSDGKHVAFVRDRQLLVMRSDGSDLQRIDVALEIIADPAWRP